MPNGSAVAGQRGFTYMGLLLFIAVAGIAMSVIGPVWHTEAQREREMELLFVGEQYARAIGSYYETTPGANKQYPASLQDLLEDRRLPVGQRHLRKLYRDPMTGRAEWGLLKVQGRISGIYSLSVGHPLKVKGFEPLWAEFSSAKNYTDWQFVYTPGNTLLVLPPGPKANLVQDAPPVADAAPSLAGDASATQPYTLSSGDHQERAPGRWR